MHTYKRHIGDYHKKAGRLSILQHGIYNLLIDACYDREHFPTKAEAIEWTWASTQDEVAALDFVLSRFFTQDNHGRFVQNRIAEEISEYHEFCEKQALKGAAGGRPKRNPAGTRREPNGNPPGFGNNPAGLKTNPQEADGNPIPITYNLEPTSVVTATSESADSNRCPVAEIISAYKQSAPSLVQPRIITDSTKAAIAARWRQDERHQTVEFWCDFFAHCERSDFLAGRTVGRNGGKPFRADLDWTVKAGNFAKIVNGNYDNE